MSLAFLIRTSSIDLFKRGTFRYMRIALCVGCCQLSYSQRIHPPRALHKMLFNLGRAETKYKAAREVQRSSNRHERERSLHKPVTRYLENSPNTSNMHFCLVFRFKVARFTHNIEFYRRYRTRRFAPRFALSPSRQC